MFHMPPLDPEFVPVFRKTQGKARGCKKPTVVLHFKLPGGPSPPSPPPAAAAAPSPDLGPPTPDALGVPIAGMDGVMRTFERLLQGATSGRWATDPPGVLLYGPPGTGKTLLAAWLERACHRRGVKYVAFDADRCMCKYTGDGEKRLRGVFEDAKRSGPTLVFMDEVDTLGVQRSAEEDPEMSSRNQASLLNVLLTCMNGTTPRGAVAVVGATNRVEVLDVALRRPGRFSQEVPMFLPDRAGRKAILAAHLPPQVEPSLLDALAGCTFRFTGADLAALARSVGDLASAAGRDLPAAPEFALALGGACPSTARRAPERDLFAGRATHPALAALLRPVVAHLAEMLVPARTTGFAPLPPGAPVPARVWDAAALAAAAHVACPVPPAGGPVFLRGPGSRAVAAAALAQADLPLFVSADMTDLFRVLKTAAAAAAAVRSPVVLLCLDWEDDEDGTAAAHVAAGSHHLTLVAVQEVSGEAASLSCSSGTLLVPGVTVPFDEAGFQDVARACAQYNTRSPEEFWATVGSAPGSSTPPHSSHDYSYFVKMVRG